MPDRKVRVVRDTATCPSCGKKGIPVKTQYSQATRSEPRKSLGEHGYCPDCQVSFKAEHVQGAMV
jgi:ribosomal protein S27AE